MRKDDTFTHKVGAYIARHRLLSAGEGVLVGVSGGADSVALLRVLQALGYRVEAAHCNFRLRGEESERDEAFVRHLCGEQGVPLHVQTFDTQSYAAGQGQSIEMAARALRYRWFGSVAEERGLRRVAVAHHREDNAETFLLNLIRGTGLRGLCGMQPSAPMPTEGDAPSRRTTLIRPLLDMSKEEVLAYLEEMGQSYVTDSTNLSPSYARNRLRLCILPELRKLNPAADANIAVTMSNLNEALAVYNACMEELAGAALDGADEINLMTVMRSPSPLSVLHILLTPLGFRRSQLVQLIESVGHVGATFISPTHRVVVDRESLIVASNEQLTSEKEQAGSSHPRLTYHWMERTPSFTIDPSPSRAYLDADKLSGALQVRPVQTGDRFVPLGMTGSRLLSDFLTDLKVNRIEKARQCVLLCGEEIAWVIGRRISEHFRVDADTRHILLVEVQ